MSATTTTSTSGWRAGVYRTPEAPPLVHPGRRHDFADPLHQQILTTGNVCRQRVISTGIEVETVLSCYQSQGI